jgi:hypothetical protein
MGNADTCSLSAVLRTFTSKPGMRRKRLSSQKCSAGPKYSRPTRALVRVRLGSGVPASIFCAATSESANMAADVTLFVTIGLAERDCE